MRETLDAVSAGYALKLIRARQQFYVMTDKATGFLGSSLRFATDPQVIDGTWWMILKWSEIGEPPPMFGVYLGEIVHNVRSALDQLMWDLVDHNGGEPGKHTQFPICETKGMWRNDIEERDVDDRGPEPTAGVAENVLRSLKAMQPHDLSKAKRETHPLVLLRNMSNVDKHRTLHVTAVRTTKPKIELLPPNAFRLGRQKYNADWNQIRPGVEFARFQWSNNPSAPMPDDDLTKVNIRGVAQLAFNEPGKASYVTMEDLRRIVRWSVIATRGLRVDGGLRTL